MVKKFASIQDVEERVERVASDNEHMGAALASERSAKLKAVEDLVAARTEAAALRTQLAAVEEDAETLEAEGRTVRERVDELEVALQQRELEAQQLASERQSGTAALAAAQLAAREHGIAAEAKAAALNAEASELTIARKKLGSLQGGLDQARQHAKALESAQAKLEAELAEERKLRGRAQREAVCLQERLRAARKRERPKEVPKERTTPAKRSGPIRSPDKLASALGEADCLRMLRKYVEVETAKVTWEEARPSPAPLTPPIASREIAPARVDAPPDLGDLLARTPQAVSIPATSPSAGSPV